MTHAINDDDPGVNAAQAWVEYRGRRRIASEEAYGLLLQAWRARFAGAYQLGDQRTREAGQVLADLGMHGPVARDELTRMARTARQEVSEELERDRAFFAIVGQLGDMQWTEEQ